jgi:dihydroorotate dehydrogenase
MRRLHLSEFLRELPYNHRLMNRDNFYEDLLRPLLFRLDPEDAHNLVHQLLGMFGGVLPALQYKYSGKDLRTEIAGREISNPIGLAAGFDKNAHLVGLLGHLGFGFAEIGSITAKPSEGNPRPRLFRLPDDRALINRLGLNGDGAKVVAQRLADSASTYSLPIAVNIAKTHDPSIAGQQAVEDLVFSFNAIKDLNILYVAINASCPNTREGCMKEKAELSAVVDEIQKANVRKTPVFIKVSPDSSESLIDDIVELGTTHGVAGYICGNTTTTRESLNTNSNTIVGIGNGGLSGPPLKSLALRTCRRFALAKTANQQIIAVGGIASGADAYQFIRAGATAIQIYTALIYRGPSLVRIICQELSQLLQKDGITLKQAIGVDLKG